MYVMEIAAPTCRQDGKKSDERAAVSDMEKEFGDKNYAHYLGIGTMKRLLHLILRNDQMNGWFIKSASLLDFWN